MFYPSLPIDELIIRRKPLPEWWNSFETINENKNEYPCKECNGLSREDAILRILSMSERLITDFKETLNLSEGNARYHMHKLLADGKVAFTDKYRKRKWRIATEVDIENKKNDKIVLNGAKIRIMEYLFEHKDEWVAVFAIAKNCGFSGNSGRVTAHLTYLFNNGFIIKKLIEGKIDNRIRHPWLYRAVKKD